MLQNMHTKAREGSRFSTCWLKRTSVDHEHGRGLARIVLSVGINMFNQDLATLIYISYKVLAATPQFKIVISNIQGSKDDRIQFAWRLTGHPGLFYLSGHIIYNLFGLRNLTTCSERIGLPK